MWVVRTEKVLTIEFISVLVTIITFRGGPRVRGGGGGRGGEREREGGEGEGGREEEGERGRRRGAEVVREGDNRLQLHY